MGAYESLEAVLHAAYAQAAEGKGKQRHVDYEDEPFERQQIVEIAKRLSGHPAAGPLFQAVKKIYESGKLTSPLAACAELYGAIVYIAAAVIVLQDKEIHHE